MCWFVESSIHDTHNNVNGRIINTQLE
jgi:hypothetical protein